MPFPSPIEFDYPPRLLVSVRDAAEAALACATGVGLIDAKDPENGALGSLPVADVRAIVASIGDQAATSAVAGEATARDGLSTAVVEMASTGIDYVKVALPLGDDDAALAALADAAPQQLIAVLFAEDGLRLDILPRLAGARCRGAMIDTRGKAGRSLRDCLTAEELTAFVTGCRISGLACGLAGSLRIGDIPALADLRPDYLGFRGGLCFGNDRRNALDGDRVRAAVLTLRACARRNAA